MSRCPEQNVAQTHEYLMHDHFLVWNDGTLFWSLAKTERGFVTVSFWNFRQQDMHSSALCCCWEWEEGTAVYRSALSQPVNLPLPTFCQFLKSIEGKRATRYSCEETHILYERYEGMKMSKSLVHKVLIDWSINWLENWQLKIPWLDLWTN